jgi:hypothetical protein
MGIIRLVLVLAVLLAGATAHAGDLCATDENANDDPKVELKQLEELAAGKPPKELFYIYCLERKTKFKARIMAACRKIVDQKDWTTGCMVVAASLQEPTLGKHDVFDWIAHLERDPWEVNSSLPDYPLYLFQMLGDPRGAALIVGTWRDSIPKAAALEKKHRGMSDWSGWRQHAAETLAAIGGERDAAFLDEQAKATIDSHVRDACNDAAAAIRKRIAASSKSPRATTP